MKAGDSHFTRPKPGDPLSGQNLIKLGGKNEGDVNVNENRKPLTKFIRAFRQGIKPEEADPFFRLDGSYRNNRAASGFFCQQRRRV
ncbi:hypothetical protein [Novosphingobium sp. PhB55]|uniref:hypothetical protein n=1 Tax=Novosphingobium sp. PhB55 TaxID=2485106 RepID=UPI001064A7C6|nr:hypothetical protein [Novosphingobium sp. PhB55]